MNCENCETQLLALLYGELDATSAASVREHSDGCASCGATRERLESARRIVRQLSVETPSPRVHAAIMTRAQAQLRGEVMGTRSSGAERADGDEAQGPLQRFVAWLGGFVLGPQVAMAMVLMLMVGVGLYYLPGLRTSRNVPGGAIVNADPGDEAGPSAAIQPAAPLDLRFDTRTNRRFPGDGTAVAHTARPGSDPSAAPAQGVVTGPLPERSGAALAELPPPAEVRPIEASVPSGGEVVTDTLQELPAAPRAARDNVPVARRLAANTADVTRPGTETVTDAPADARAQLAIAALDSERPAAAQTSPPQALATRAEGDLQQAAPAPSPAPMVAVASTTRTREPSQPSAPARNAPAAPSVMPSQYAPRMPTGGSASAGAGGAVGANTGSTAPQTQAQSPLLAAAGLHGIARNQASAHVLRSAISTYESLLARFPTYDRRGDAMLELAELYRRVGDLSRARSWIARAEGLPAYTVRARQQRFRVDEMDHARSSVPTAAAPSGN